MICKAVLRVSVRDCHFHTQRGMPDDADHPPLHWKCMEKYDFASYTITFSVKIIHIDGCGALCQPNSLRTMTGDA